MPRLDVSDRDTVNKLESEDVDVETFIDLGVPIDVCIKCYDSIGFQDDVDAPYYEDQPGKYICAICGEVLGKED